MHNTKTNDCTPGGTGNIKFTPSNLPKDSKELVKNGWKDVTPAGMAKNTTSREYIDPETGMKGQVRSRQTGGRWF